MSSTRTDSARKRALLIGAFALACAAPAGPAQAPDAGRPPPVRLEPPHALSSLGLFDLTRPPEGGRLHPTAGNVPYDLPTALFSDYALKSRTMRIPDGAAAAYEPEKVLAFPVGTILTKTFAFPKDERRPEVDVRVVETRLLVRQPTGWEAFAYVWNADQTDATYAPGGRVYDIAFTDPSGTPRAAKYLVPSKNQCQECHHFKGEGSDQILTPIGPKARYLNHDLAYDGRPENELAHLARLGLLTGLPADPPRAPNAFDPADGDLATRARTYLDINCAHCHNPEGTAGQTSQLFLNIENTNAFNLGGCKRPGSAGSDVGGSFDIEPGNHAASILWFRMQTAESGKMMPQLGRSLRHDEGAQLIADWIDGLPTEECATAP
jgi:uncharacterized repeat protein (TIGR03806 family)